MSKKNIFKILICVIFIAIICFIAINIINKNKDKKVANKDTNPYMLQENCEIIEEDTNKGMTIKDSYGNEWVWIVVPKTEVFKTVKNEEDYEKIEYDIQEYVKSYSSEEYADNYEEFKELKQKTLKSIYKYGGFWISRYEIGTKETRDAENLVEVEPLSKPNMYVYNNATFEEAQKLSNQISNGEYKSNLLFGFQWDLVCKFIEKNGYTNSGDKITEQMVNGNSSDWGNYYTSTFKLSRGKYSTDYGREYEDIEENEIKKQYRNYLLTTGASEQNKACNIYDFAGNVSEWTLEKSTTEGEEWSIIRDGNFYFNYGGNDPVNGRFIVAPTSRNASYGFRVAIYSEN